LIWSSAASAQDPAQNQSQPAAKSTSQSCSTQAQQQQPIADASDQSLSLAELARQARAKKQIDANPFGQSGDKPASKSVKLLDDDNMRGGSYAADNSAHSGSGP
jgi:hypothetical protein